MDNAAVHDVHGAFDDRSTIHKDMWYREAWFTKERPMKKCIQADVARELLKKYGPTNQHGTGLFKVKHRGVNYLQLVCVRDFDKKANTDMEKCTFIVTANKCLQKKLMRILAI